MSTIELRRNDARTADARAADARGRASRLDDIDRSKGLAIILVVLGHIVAREVPVGDEWYGVLRSVLYSFHMPFFMYLGGVVFFASGHALHPRPDYPRYLLRRAERLLVPFVLFGLIIVFGKMVAQHLIYVDNNPPSIATGLRTLLWDTADSPATSVWYIFVLFVYCLATPPLLRLLGGRMPALIGLAAVLFLIGAPPYAYLDRIAHFYIFFAIGLAAGACVPAAMAIVDRGFPVFAALFVAALVLVALDVRPELSVPLSAFLSIPALHGLVRRGASGSQVLLFFGGHAFVIYLLNTILIGVTKGVMLKVLPWDGINFALFAPALMTAGLFGPILVKHVVLRHIRYLDRMTD